MSDRRTPFYDWHVANKARMVPFGGWEMPVQYTSIIEEHKAVRNSAGLFDISHMARLSIGGPDALAFLDKIFTNSVATMKFDQVRYGLICNEAGGILDDVLIYRWPYGFSMVVNASNREKILAWMEVHRAGLNVDIDDRTEHTVMVAVQGPKSVDLVQGMFEADVSKLKYYYATPTLYCRQPCVVSRTGYTGEDGFEIIVSNEFGLSVWEELRSRGALPCGLGARDTLRLEAAMPLYGHELNEKIDPLQAGLNWAVKLDKPFIGREALQEFAEVDTQGIRPQRIGLKLEGKRAAREGSTILAAGSSAVGSSVIGQITSGSYTPHLEASIAMGYAVPRFAMVGSQVLVDLRGTQVPATVVPLPFYKRSK
jgi:aminomethyltransferase